MTNIMFPHTFDSTMISTGRACPNKLFRQYVEHWKPKHESVHLIAGGAFASGVEAARRAFFEGKATAETIVETPTGLQKEKTLFEVEANNAEIAQAYGLQALMLHYGDFECPSDSAKSLERMCGALEFYFDKYPMGFDGTNPITFSDGRRGIEFSFAQPLPINHPVTGAPILYTGRADLIAEFAGGVYIFDEKTTSSLGASWLRQWEHRSQFTGYAWAAREAGIETSGSIVRGVSILKTKYDTLQAITNRAGWEIDRWLEQTCRDIERFIGMWKEGWWDYSLDHACVEFGGCSFSRICKAENPETWLPIDFEKRVWDPLARRELTVAEWEESWGHTPKNPGIIIS